MLHRRMRGCGSRRGVALAWPPAARQATPAPAAATRQRGADGLKIGIKFDQPGLGLKKGTEYTGFDVDVAKYVAKELGTDAPTSPGYEAPSPQRETLIETGQVDYIVATYSINDERKEKVSFAGPYFVAGQDLLVRADDTASPDRTPWPARSCARSPGSTSAQKVKDTYPRGTAAGVRHLLRVRRGAGRKARRRPHHRRHHPGRVRRAARVRGQAQGGRQDLLQGALRHRPEEGRHRHLREGQRRHRRR